MLGAYLLADRLIGGAMGIYGVSGAACTGKTTLVQAIARLRPEWDVQFEWTTIIVPAMGYRSPWDIQKEYGSAFFEAILIASFAPLVSFREGGVLVTDLTPLDHYVYYKILSSAEERKFDAPLDHLMRHYLQFYACTFILPLHVIPFVEDDMRTVDVQVAFDRELRQQIAEKRVFAIEVQAKTTDARAQFVIQRIEELEGVSGLR